jgi:K+-transporting ATPase KdpF subunit
LGLVHDILPGFELPLKRRFSFIDGFLTIPRGFLTGICASGCTLCHEGQVRLTDVDPFDFFPRENFFLSGCGFTLPRIDPPVAARQLGIDRRVRPADGGYKMTVLYLFAGLITLSLLVYLLLALLKPEWFG